MTSVTMVAKFSGFQLPFLTVQATVLFLSAIFAGQRCEDPEILLPWQRYVTTSPLYCITTNFIVVEEEEGGGYTCAKVGSLTFSNTGYPKQTVCFNGPIEKTKPRWDPSRLFRSSCNGADHCVKVVTQRG